MTTIVTIPTITIPAPTYTNPNLGIFGVIFAPIKATVVGADKLYELAKGAIKGVAINPVDFTNLGLGSISGFEQSQYVSIDGSNEFNLYVKFSGLNIGTFASVNIHHSQVVTNSGTKDKWWIDAFFQTAPDAYASTNWFTEGADSGLLLLSRSESIGHVWRNGNIRYSDMFENGVLSYLNISMENPILPTANQSIGISQESIVTLVGQAHQVESMYEFH
jgi:hypothetical protein